MVESATLQYSIFNIYSDSVIYKMELPFYRTDYIQGNLAKSGKPYEHEMLQAMSLGLSVGDLVLDVGANIGSHTLYLACVLGCRVCAFEPNARLYEPLERSVALNGVEDLVEVFPVGAGSAPFKAVLGRLDESNLGAQSLVPSDETNSIDVIRIDDKVFDAPVVAIKVDVEGMELDVLEGAENLIKKDRPLLVVEAGDVESYRALEGFIKRNGYVYCSSFNGTPTHFFIHQDKVSNSPWINLFFEKGFEFYQMRHFHKKLKKVTQQLDKIRR